MSTDRRDNKKSKDKIFPSDQTRQIIFSIRRLIQASELYTKELNPDRRMITIQLTDAGKKLAKNAPPPIQQKIIDGLKQTKDTKIKQIVTSLNMLTDMLDVQDLEVK
ncbi:MAG: hypothetical protein P8012_16780 [Desulfobacterales bacterium]